MQTVDISVGAKGVPTVTLKTKASITKPVAGSVAIPFRKGYGRSKKQVNNLVAQYRPDLTKLAVHRFKRVNSIKQTAI